MKLKTVITLPICGTDLTSEQKKRIAQKTVHQLRTGIGANLYDAILCELLTRDVEHLTHFKDYTVAELIDHLTD